MMDRWYQDEPESAAPEESDASAPSDVAEQPQPEMPAAIEAAAQSSRPQDPGLYASEDPDTGEITNQWGGSPATADVGSPARDDWRQRYEPVLYPSVPTDTEVVDRQGAPVNPAFAGMQDALGQAHDLMLSVYDQQAGSTFGGFDTNVERGGVNYGTQPLHTIGININPSEQVGAAFSTPEGTSDKGLGLAADLLTQAMAHEIAHDSVTEHGQQHRDLAHAIYVSPAATQAHDLILAELYRMREAGTLARWQDESSYPSREAGTQPVPGGHLDGVAPDSEDQGGPSGPTGYRLPPIEYFTGGGRP